MVTGAVGGGEWGISVYGCKVSVSRDGKALRVVMVIIKVLNATELYS